MDGGSTMLLTGLIAAVGGLATYLQIRSMRRRAAEARTRETSAIYQVNGPKNPSLRAGYETTPHPWGWSVVSGPKIRYRVTAEIPRPHQHPEKPTFVRLETGQPDMSGTLARLLVGPLQKHWTWRDGVWVSELSPHELDHEADDPEIPSARFSWARTRVDDIDELARLTKIGASLTPEQDQLIARRLIPDDDTLDKLAKTLTEKLAKTHPAIVRRIGDHLDAPSLWLGLMNAPRVKHRALERLLTRWPNSEAESHAIDRALLDLWSLNNTLLELVFGALDRRRDSRLAEVLVSLIANPNHYPGATVLKWLERRGDASAIGPLLELQARCRKELREEVTQTITAIRFRLAEALNHTLGGLSVAEDGGTLALAEESKATARP